MLPLNDNAESPPPSESQLSFNEELSLLLQNHFPAKSRDIDNMNWDEEEQQPKKRSSMCNSTKTITILLRCLAGNNMHTSSEILKHMINSNNTWHANIVNNSTQSVIASNIKTHVRELTGESRTKKRKPTQDDIDLLIKASSSNPDTDIRKILNYYNITG